MRNAIWIFGLTLVLGGCVVQTAERDGLPRGVTLLDSANGYCNGPLEIETDPDVTIEEGEDITLAVEDDDDVEWECESDRSEGDLECPDGTTYLRITRGDAPEFTLECFGVT